MGSMALLAVGLRRDAKHAEMVTSPGANVPTPPNVDRTKCDEKGKNVITADTNLDQKADVWKFYQSVDVGGQKTEILTCKEVDLNHDGKIDLVYYYDDKGAQLTLDEADTDFDGKFDMTRYYANGKVVREERTPTSTEARRLEVLRGREAGSPGARHQRRRQGRRVGVLRGRQAGLHRLRHHRQRDRQQVGPRARRRR